MPTPTDRDEEVEEKEELSGQMSFLDHLEELRRRLLNSLIAVGVALAACLYFSFDIYNVFSQLAEDAGADLNSPSPGGGFMILIQMAVMAAIFLASPFLLAQVWLFISPGLYQKERRYVVPFIIFSSALFILGGLFGYFIAVPIGLKYLFELNKLMGLSNTTSVDLAFDLVFALEIGLGVVFEIPAVIFLLSRLGLVTGSFLLKNLKYAILLCFVAAALITPTGDIGNMMIVGLPMIALYIVGIGIAYVFGKKRQKD